MNDKDLKLKIVQLYKNILCNENTEYMIGLDAVKSVVGIDRGYNADNILSWINKNIKIKKKLPISDNYKSMPEAISFYSLEESLISRNIDKSKEYIYYLSRVSDGIQILEYLLEFSLSRCNIAYRYIWHSLRMKYFIDSVDLKDNLFCCVDFIIKDMNDVNIADQVNGTLKEISWIDIFNKDLGPTINDVLLFHTISKANLTRSRTINKLIKFKLSSLNIEEYKQIKQLEINEEQIKIGRAWLLHYLNENININKTRLDEVIFINNIRSSLMATESNKMKTVLWNQLNNYLCS